MKRLSFCLSVVFVLCASVIYAGGALDRPGGPVLAGGGPPGACAGDPPCGAGCPPERPICKGWDAVCGCDKDGGCKIRDNSSGNSSSIATFTSIRDSESGDLIAILNESVEGIVAHSQDWGGGNQRIKVPLSQAFVRAQLIGPGESVEERWRGWTAWQVTEAQVEVPPFRSIALLGALTPIIRMSLCDEGRNPSVARIFVHDNDGEIAGWIPLDIAHPDLPLPFSLAWTGEGYVSLEVRGFVKNGMITLTDNSRVYASSSHP